VNEAAVEVVGFDGEDVIEGAGGGEAAKAMSMK
jgi:hypothetical protein